MYDNSTLTLGYKLRSFFTLIFAVLYFKSNARHIVGVHSPSDASSAFGASFPKRRISWPPFPLAIPFPIQAMHIVHAHSASKAGDVAMVMSIS